MSCSCCSVEQEEVQAIVSSSTGDGSTPITTITQPKPVTNVTGSENKDRVTPAVKRADSTTAHNQDGQGGQPYEGKVTQLLSVLFFLISH